MESKVLKHGTKVEEHEVCEVVLAYNKKEVYLTADEAIQLIDWLQDWLQEIGRVTG